MNKSYHKNGLMIVSYFSTTKPCFMSTEYNVLQPACNAAATVRLSNNWKSYLPINISAFLIVPSVIFSSIQFSNNCIYLWIIPCLGIFSNRLVTFKNSDTTWLDLIGLCKSMPFAISFHITFASLFKKISTFISTTISFIIISFISVKFKISKVYRAACKNTLQFQSSAFNTIYNNINYFLRFNRYFFPTISFGRVRIMVGWLGIIISVYISITLIHESKKNLNKPQNIFH